MARVITNVKDFETWKSNLPGTLWIKRFDRSGNEIDERIDGGREVRVLPEERRLNQEIAATPELDPFQNGQLVPLKLVESAEDYDELRSYGNHLTEADMRALLKKPKAVAELVTAIESISNPTTLVRFLAISEEEEVDATVRQVKAIKDRLTAVQAQTDYFENEVATVQTSEGRDVKVTNAPIAALPIDRANASGR